MADIMHEDNEIVTTETERPVVAHDPVTGEVVTTSPATARTYRTEAYSDDPYARRRYQTYKLQQAVYLLFAILEGLLAIRFVLRVLSANPNAGFASFVYGVTAPFMAPFAGLFGTPSYAGSVFDWNVLVAILVYALIAWVAARIVGIIAGEGRSAVRTSRVDTRIDR
jgi:YggT family protein